MNTYDNISLNSSQNGKCLDETCRENPNTHFPPPKIFSPQNRAFYGIMCKNVVEPDIPQMTV